MNRASPRDAYLAYQSEIGTEEVVFPAPWIRKGSIVAPKETPKGTPRFFQSIADVLVEASPSRKSAPLPEPVARPAMLSLLPEFKDLDAYWNHLAVEYPKWLPALQGQALVRAEGASNPILTLVELSPSPSPVPGVFNGDVGMLLDKMMKAIHLDRSRLYLTSVMKTPPSGRSWPRKDIAKMLPAFFQELRLAGCSTVLLLGETCAQAVLRTGSGLDALRQQALEAEGFVFTASYHPADLENNEELKRKAWKDLQWLQPRLGMELKK